MKKQCPLCGRLYSRFRQRCADCNTFLVSAIFDEAGEVGDVIRDPVKDPSSGRILYCHHCNEEYYDSLEYCPECNSVLKNEKPPPKITMDEHTKEYWDSPDKWEILETPKTYNEVFYMIRYLKENDIKALAAFLFKGYEPVPLTLDDTERLEINTSSNQISNPLPGVGDNFRYDYLKFPRWEKHSPTLCILGKKEELNDARKLLEIFNRT